MRTRYVFALFAVMAALLLPGTAHAQCSDFYCETFAVYNPGPGTITGYSLYDDYGISWGWWLQVQSYVSDPNENYNPVGQSWGYDYVEVDFTYTPAMTGGYTAWGYNYYDLEVWWPYDGASFYDVDVSGPTGPQISSCPSPSWVLGGNTVDILGSGFSETTPTLSWSGNGGNDFLNGDSWIEVSSDEEIIVYADLSPLSTQGTLTADAGVAACQMVVPPIQPPPPPPPPAAISSSNSLWFFGTGIGVAPGFTLGDVKTTLTAQGTDGGSWAWTITAGVGKVSFSSTDPSATTAQGNPVTLYSLGWSTARNDVTVSLVWTDPSGDTSPASLSLSVDSPYKIVLDSGTNPTNVGLDSSNTSCYTQNPVLGKSGYQSVWYYQSVSFLGVLISNEYINESFGTASLGPGANVPGYNWLGFTPNNGLTTDGTFGDYICEWDTGGGTTAPMPLPPQSPLSGSLVLSALQWLYVGSGSSGQGIQVQEDTQQRFLDHGVIAGITSPVR